MQYLCAQNWDFRLHGCWSTRCGAIDPQPQSTPVYSIHARFLRTNPYALHMQPTSCGCLAWAWVFNNWTPFRPLKHVVYVPSVCSDSSSLIFTRACIVTFQVGIYSEKVSDRYKYQVKMIKDLMIHGQDVRIPITFIVTYTTDLAIYVSLCLFDGHILPSTLTTLLHHLAPHCIIVSFVSSI